MIVSNLIGGLGNQMFQYAAGMAYSKKIGTDFKIDISDFGKYGLHNGFELEKLFGVNNIALDLNGLGFGLYSSKTLRRILRKLNNKNLFFRNYLSECSVEYFSEKKQAQLYLDGYWQDEKFFINAVPELKKIFRFRDHPSRLDEISELINKSNSVALHIRRGDYITNKAAASIYGVCDLNYYRRAIDFVKSRTKKPRFFVFSDDTEWAKNNFIGDDFLVVDQNRGEDSCWDMYLISLCTSAIISNSTFSWWGAWLGEGDGHVIAPSKWFINRETNIVPARWVKISNE